jgi:hypothetical protein
MTRVQTVAAGPSSGAQIDRAGIQHVPKLDEGLVRSQICIDDPPTDTLGALHCQPMRGQIWNAD